MFCTALASGSLFHGEHLQFIEIIQQFEASIGSKYWLPYTDNELEGQFKNIYSKSAFNESLFLNLQPSGRRSQNNLYWNGVGVCDTSDEDINNSLCKPKKIPKNVKIRGLCPSSLIHRTFRPTMSYNGPSMVWIGLGKRKSIIQYNKISKSVELTTLNTLERATINIKNPSQLIGKHEWTIYEDFGCSTEQYVKNISFR